MSLSEHNTRSLMLTVAVICALVTMALIHLFTDATGGIIP